MALALLTFQIDVVFAPPPTCSPLVKQVTQPRRVMQLIKTSLSLAKPPPVYFILLFSFDHTTLHWLPLPILPTVDCFGGAPSTTAVVHKLLFRPVSSRETWAETPSVGRLGTSFPDLCEIVQMGQIPKPPWVVLSQCDCTMVLGSCGLNLVSSLPFQLSAENVANK